MTAPFLSTDEIRDHFSKTMSAMYQKEVPKYSNLLELVQQVNNKTLDVNPQLAQHLKAHDELHRLDVERHGAIRIGKPKELFMLRRLFAVMGMYPVGYYDLSPAGVPVHSTCFRPIDDTSLAINPFRVFTSLLRLELIESEPLRKHAAEVLAQRDIFTPGVKTLIERCEHKGGLTETEALRFVDEALETFRWHSDATVDKETYEALHSEHRLIADIVCFHGPHINHLTPRTLDIDAVQMGMTEVGIDPKLIIEGPPRRENPILLRQTSFKALDEAIHFTDDSEGSHTARFGEIEQRGQALTAKGRELYDKLLTNSRELTRGLSNDAHQRVLGEAFAEFPDTAEEIRQQELGFFEYRLAPNVTLPNNIDVTDIDALIAAGVVTVSPMTYEDFLPVSAAGIFQSNLGDNAQSAYNSDVNREVFEEALGAEVIDEITLYQRREMASISKVIEALYKKI